MSSCKFKFSFSSLWVYLFQSLGNLQKILTRFFVCRIKNLNFVDDFLIDTQIPFSIYTPQQFLNILPETPCENIHLVNIPSVQQFLGFQNQNFCVFRVSTINTQHIMSRMEEKSVKISILLFDHTYALC